VNTIEEISKNWDAIVSVINGDLPTLKAANPSIYAQATAVIGGEEITQDFDVDLIQQVATGIDPALMNVVLTRAGVSDVTLDGEAIKTDAAEEDASSSPAADDESSADESSADDESKSADDESSADEESSPAESDSDKEESSDEELDSDKESDDEESDSDKESDDDKDSESSGAAAFAKVGVAAVAVAVALF
ncbi:hypothetical protein GGF43_001667, partial [Coemansia sp. RSA 2618]